MPEQQSEKRDMHFRGVCLFPLCAFPSVSVQFFFLTVMSNVHNLFPAAMFCAIMVSDPICPPSNLIHKVGAIYRYVLCALFQPCFLSTPGLAALVILWGHADNTFRQIRNPFIFYDQLHFFITKEHCPLIPLKAGKDCLHVSIAYKCLRVVTLNSKLSVHSDSCEKGRVTDGKTCISKPLKGFQHQHS